MKTKIDRILEVLLGLAFVVFGLNKFLGFMPPPELPGPASAFMGALVETGYMLPLIALAEIVAGLLILSRVFTALGLVLLVPVTVNIVLFHLFLAPVGGVPGYLLAAVNVYLLFTHMPRYRPILRLS